MATYEFAVGDVDCYPRQDLTYVFKHHVSCTDGKISVTIKIVITFIFRFRRRSILLVVFVTVSNN